MAVTVDQAAVYTLGKVESALSAVERSTLGVVVAWANEAVSAYLGDSPAPAATVTAATLRLIYYDWHTRVARRPADGGMLDARFRRDAPLSPLRASGARSLLSPHKRRGVGTAA